MAWFKADDKLHSSIKWRTTTKGGRALWTTAGSWCMDQLTDGFVPSSMLAVLDGTDRDAASLVSSGLWENVPGGWRFHDWSDYQPSREKVLKDRAEAAERQKRAREKAREKRRSGEAVTQVSQRDSRRDDRVTHSEVTGVVTVPPTRPDPTRPASPVSHLRVVGDGDQVQSVTDVTGEDRAGLDLGC